MERIQLTSNLYLDEYIPRELYLEYQFTPNKLIGLLDNRLLNADQQLRNKFGSVTINNWWGLNDVEYREGRKAGIIFNERGFRKDTTSVGAGLSQHKYGRGSDKIFKNATSDEVREYIKKNYLTLGITCIEDKVTWVHSDVRFLIGNNLLIVNP